MTYPQWLNPAPAVLAFVGALYYPRIVTHKVWSADPPHKKGGRTKGAKDLKPRKIAKLSPSERATKNRKKRVDWWASQGVKL